MLEVELCLVKSPDSERAPQAVKSGEGDTGALKNKLQTQYVYAYFSFA